MSYKSALNKYIKYIGNDLDKVKEKVGDRWIKWSGNVQARAGKGEKTRSSINKDVKTLKRMTKKIDDNSKNLVTYVGQLKDAIYKQDWGQSINSWLDSKVNDFGKQSTSGGDTRNSRPASLTGVKIKKVNVKLKHVEKCITLANQIGKIRKQNLDDYNAAKNYFDKTYKSHCKAWKNCAESNYNYWKDYKNENADMDKLFKKIYKVIYVAGVSANLIHDFMYNAQQKLKGYSKSDKGKKKKITKAQATKAVNKMREIQGQADTAAKKASQAKTAAEAKKYYDKLKKLRSQYKKQWKIVKGYSKALKNANKKSYEANLAKLNTMVAGAQAAYNKLKPKVTNPGSGGENGDSDGGEKKKQKSTNKKKTKSTKKASSTKKKLNKLSKQIKKQQKEIKKMKKAAAAKEKQVEADKKAAEEQKQKEITELKETQEKEITDLKEEQQKEFESLRETLTFEQEEKLAAAKDEYSKSLDSKNDEISDLKQEIENLKADSQRSSAGESSSGSGGSESAAPIDETPSTGGSDSDSGSSSSSSSSSGDNSGVSDPTGATLGAASGSQTDPITGSGSDSGSETDTGDTTSADDVSVIDENAEPTPTKSSSGGGSVIPGVLGVAAAGAAGFAGVRYIKNKNKDKFIVDEYDDSDEDEEDYSYNDKSEASGEKYKAGSDKVNNLSLDEEQDIKIGEDYDDDDDVNEELE